jgi:hypothetical protein
VNAPDGGDDWPSSFNPQQAIEPSVRTPQVCRSPELTVVNVPAGGDDWP